MLIRLKSSQIAYLKIILQIECNVNVIQKRRHPQAVDITIIDVPQVMRVRIQPGQNATIVLHVYDIAKAAMYQYNF